jgi:DNA-binding MarR family transcriptional regulator
MRGLFLAGRAASELLDYVQALADRHGLTPARVRVLTALGFQIPEELATPAALADKLRLSRSNITGLLDGLEKDGLLERAHDPVDRRSVRLGLTGPGRALAARLVLEIAEAAGSLAAAFESDDGDLERTAGDIERALARAKAGGAAAGRP